MLLLIYVKEKFRRLLTGHFLVVPEACVPSSLGAQEGRQTLVSFQGRAV
jgi:hypothetical protein